MFFYIWNTKMLYTIQIGQSLVTKLVIILGYNLTQYLFNGGRF